MMTQKASAFLFLLITSLISVLVGLDYVGNVIEKIIQGLAQLCTFFVLVGLYGIWKQLPVFTSKGFAFLAYATLLLSVVRFAYPLYEYSEQSFSTEYFTIGFFDVLLGLLLCVLFIKESCK